MKNKTVRFRYGTIWKSLNTPKKTKRRSQKKKKVNIVVGQDFLPQTMFADDGNRSPCVSNWSLSARGQNLAHLTGSTTRTWPP